MQLFHHFGCHGRLRRSPAQNREGMLQWEANREVFGTFGGTGRSPELNTLQAGASFFREEVKELG